MRDTEVEIRECRGPKLVRAEEHPRLQTFYGLPEDVVFNYVNFLRQSAEIVPLNPLVTAPIRDVNLLALAARLANWSILEEHGK